MTAQPEWKLLHTLGDIGYIVEDATGVYPPEAEVWQDYENAKGETRILVYRFAVEQKSVHDGNLIPFGFDKRDDLPHPLGRYTEWYSDSIAEVARSCGTTAEDEIERLCDPDPVKRFWAYFDIGGYHGWENFDSYPLDLSEEEFENRVDNCKAAC